MSYQWQDITSTAYYGLRAGYINYTSHLLRTSSSGNTLAVLQLTPGNTYKIECVMCRRFRGMSANTATPPDNTASDDYWVNDNDLNDTTEYNQLTENIIVPTNAYEFVFLWTSGSSRTYDEIVSTLKVYERIEVIDVSSVSLNTSVLDMDVNDTSQLVATCLPTGCSQEVTWSSSNNSIASVVNGLVTAVGPGQAVITCASVEGPSATCSVNVTQPVTSVVLSSHSVDVNRGSTEQLSAICSPSGCSQNVVWSSSNNSIATVVDGLITGVGPGLATITCASVEGPFDTCEVEVHVPVTNIIFNTHEVNISIGRTTSVECSIVPNDATDVEVTIDNTNPSVATYNNGVITALSAGTAVITEYLTADSTIRDSINVTVTDVIYPSDADFNATSRIIEAKVDMYLFGDDAAPVTMDKGSYLIDMSILEEASADTDNPFGGVTANELTITLFNDNGMFSPTNEESPYYGRMVKGIKCAAYIRSVGTEWSPLGVFYVSDWKATITGITADVTADDALYDVFDAADVQIPVVKNEPFAEFYSRVFTALDISTNIDSSLTEVLQMSYNNSSNKDLLSDMATGAMALCNCGHDGVVQVKPLTASQDVRAILTDSDQIISVQASFSIAAGYSGATVTYNVPQESAVGEVLKVSGFNVPVGTNASIYYALSKLPLIRLAYASLIGPGDAYVSDIDATSNMASVTTVNYGTVPAVMPLVIEGTFVENVASTIGDTGNNLMSVDCPFIQSSTYASTFLQVLQRYIASAMPILEMETRGNPLLNIGDKIIVQSTKYNINFTGILIRQQFNYNGALTSQMTLLDASLLEVT